jgi:hypothetical protein
MTSRRRAVLLLLLLLLLFHPVNRLILESTM